MSVDNDRRFRHAGGRFAKAYRKSYVFCVRVTAADEERILNEAERLSLGVSEYVRDIVQDHLCRHEAALSAAATSASPSDSSIETA